jgi:hypothetical protein
MSWGGTQAHTPLKIAIEKTAGTSPNLWAGSAANFETGTASAASRLAQDQRERYPIDLFRGRNP